MGLTRPGEILVDLPDDFALRRHDMPPIVTEEGPGNALPKEILSQLCERRARHGDANRRTQHPTWG
ncbi:hypothetical protein ACIBO4_34630 [Streptomyces sp. NPDC050149]|uniref:hypothetical protein n=1 Tax=Streptomyces sp. NPDC050149 TaxID=3365603 RepID=UPI003796743B